MNIYFKYCLEIWQEFNSSLKIWQVLIWFLVKKFQNFFYKSFTETLVISRYFFLDTQVMWGLLVYHFFFSSADGAVFFNSFFFHILGCKSNLQLPKNASLLKGASFISRTITANIAPHLSSFNGVYFCTFQIIFIYAPSPFITRLKRGYTSAGEVYLCRFYVYLRHVSEMTRGKDKCWICLWYFVSLFSWDI